MNNIYQEKYVDALDGFSDIHPGTKIGKNVIIGRNVIIEKYVTIGDNCFIGHNAIIRPHVTIGDNSHIRSFCFIAADAKIGSFTQIMQYSNICRECVVEDRVFVGMGCMTTNTRKIAYLRDYDDVSDPPIIRWGSRIGARVTILPGVIIAPNTLVGAGSVVTKTTKPGRIYIGVPAKDMGMVDEEELILP